MATFSPILPGTVLSHRTTLITAVAAGDQLVISDILGRPAQGVKFITTAIADTVDFRVNNYLSLAPNNNNLVPKWPAQQVESVKVWAVSPEFPVQQATGALELFSVSGLLISSLEIVALSLSVGTTISIIVW